MRPRTIVINESYSTPHVEVRGDAIAHHFDEDKLGEGPARAIATLIRDQIRAISVRASDATIRARESARRALARGAPWAVRRYAGNMPNGSERAYNDSGALADVVARLVAGAWEIATSPTRLDQPRFGSAGDFASMLFRLRELVPALRAPLEQPEVRKAIERTLPEIIRVRRR